MSAPKYLVPQRIERGDGAGEVIDLGEDRGKLLLITLGINHVLEKACLAASIWGSASGTEWGPRPLVSFPQKCYCGVYSTFLNLEQYPRVRYLRVEWKMSRWDKGRAEPLFGFYLFIEPSRSEVSTAVA